MNCEKEDLKKEKIRHTFICTHMPYHCTLSALGAGCWEPGLVWVWRAICGHSPLCWLSPWSVSAERSAGRLGVGLDLGEQGISPFSVWGWRRGSPTLLSVEFWIWKARQSLVGVSKHCFTWAAWKLSVYLCAQQCPPKLYSTLWVSRDSVFSKSVNLVFHFLKRTYFLKENFASQLEVESTPCVERG